MINIFLILAFAEFLRSYNRFNQTLIIASDVLNITKLILSVGLQ